MHHYGSRPMPSICHLPGPPIFNSQYFHKERSSKSEIIILQGAVPKEADINCDVNIASDLKLNLRRA
jgi:hypothetical protein